MCDFANLVAENEGLEYKPFRVVYTVTLKKDVYRGVVKEFCSIGEAVDFFKSQLDADGINVLCIEYFKDQDVCGFV